MGTVKFWGLLSVFLCVVACSGQANNNANNDVSNCNQAETDGSEYMGIVGGKTLYGNGPIARSVVAIYGLKDNHEYICTGTLLKGNVVLTAAHCVGDKMAIFFTNSLMCELKKSKANLESKYRAVIKSVIPKEYKNNSDGTQSFNAIYSDIGLLKFVGSIPAGYEELDLPSEKIQIQSHERVIISGFGRTTSTEDLADPKLRISSFSSEDIDQSDESLIVSRQSHTGVCQGDSGGSIFVYRDGKLHIAGVTSSVTNPNDKEKACEGYGIFVRPTGSLIRDWLNLQYNSLKN